MKVHAAVDQLKAGKEALKEYINQFTEDTLKMEYDVDDFTNMWRDAGYVKFKNSMSDFSAELKKMQTSLDTYTDFVESYANSLTEFEEKFSNTNINLS